MLKLKGGVHSGGLQLMLLLVTLVYAAPPVDRLSHKVEKRSSPLNYGDEILVGTSILDPKRKAPLGYGDEILDDTPTVDPKRKAPFGYGDEILDSHPVVDLNRKAPLGYADDKLHVFPTVSPSRKAPLGYGDDHLHVYPTVEPKRKAPLGYGDEILDDTPTVDPKRTAPLGYDDEEIYIPKRNSRQILINYFPQMIYAVPDVDSPPVYNTAQSRINYKSVDNEQESMQVQQEPYIIPFNPVIYFVPQNMPISPLVRTSPQFYATLPFGRQQIVSTLQGYLTQAASQAVGFVTNQASNVLPSLPITVNVPNAVTGIVNRLTTVYQYGQQAWQNRPLFLRPTTTPRPPIEAVVAEQENPNPPAVDADPDPLDPERKKPEPHEFGPL